MGLVTLVTGLLLALTWYILSRSFLRMATATGKSKKAALKANAIRSRSMSGALLSREFGRFLSSPNYILNCSFGTLFLLVLGVAVLIKGSALLPALDKINGQYPGFIPVLACAAVCMVASMNDMAAPSVSLEGKNLWLVQSLPVEPWAVLRAKLSVQLILTAIPAFLCCICIGIILPGSLSQLLLMGLTVMLFVVLSALFCLFMGVKFPNLTWTNEVVPIKQSFSVFLAMMGSWVYTIALGAGYFLCRRLLSATAYLSVISLFTALLSLLLYRWLRTRGTKIFATL